MKENFSDVGFTWIPIWIPLIFALTLPIHHIYKHLTNFHEPRLQLYIVRIILMIPVYSLQAYLSTLFPKYALIFDILKDSYEAYVLYIFLQLLIQYIGGENIIIAHLEAKETMAHPWPYTNFLRPLELDRAFFKNVKKGILQFVFIKPFISFLNIFFSSQQRQSEDLFNFKSGYFYCSIINNISVTIALYSLVLFYRATREKLMPYNPFWKFLLIKSLLFFSYWQSLAISILLKLNFFGDPLDLKTVHKALSYQDTIILFEMAIAGIVFHIVFTYEDFCDWSKPAKPILTNLSQVLSMKDLITDAKSTFGDDEDEEYETPLKEIIREDGELISNKVSKQRSVSKMHRYEKFL